MSTKGKAVFSLPSPFPLSRMTIHMNKKFLAGALLTTILVSACGTDEWASAEDERDAYASLLCSRALKDDAAAQQVFTEILTNKDDYSHADYKAAMKGILHLEGAEAIGGENLEIDAAGDGSCSGWLWNKYREQNWDDEEMRNFKPSDARELGLLED